MNDMEKILAGEEQQVQALLDGQVVAGEQLYHCPKCGQDKPATAFYKDVNRSTGLRCYCRACQDVERTSKENRDRQHKIYQTKKQQDPRDVMWRAAKMRAKKEGVAFNITRENIYIPAHCPVLGIPLVVNKGIKQDNSPSLDRINPDGAYVVGNIATISWRANKLKKNATLKEYESLLSFLKSYRRAGESRQTVVQVNINKVEA